MVKLDTNWFNTEAGTNILQSVKNNGKLKTFGKDFTYKKFMKSFYFHFFC
jgi:hypothetical protein